MRSCVRRAAVDGAMRTNTRFVLTEERLENLPKSAAAAKDA
jgi:hypothetical protein